MLKHKSRTCLEDYCPVRLPTTSFHASIADAALAASLAQTEAATAAEHRAQAAAAAEERLVGGLFERGIARCSARLCINPRYNATHEEQLS